MKIEMNKKSAVSLENLARYICCILNEKDGLDEIENVRKGRKSLCKALGIKYDVEDEII